MVIPTGYTEQVTPGGAEFWGSDGHAHIHISPLSADFPRESDTVLLDSRTEGPLTVERYEYAPGGQRHPGALTITVLRGRTQQAVFFGVPGAEVDRRVSECIGTIKPELVASAARRAKGCASDTSARSLFDRLLGRDHPSPQVTISSDDLKSGVWIGWRLNSINPTSPLGRMGIKDTFLMSICGVSVKEIAADAAHVCCATDISRSVQVELRSADGVKKTLDVPTDSP
jgi:hypothetical protein